ncbi:MAG: cph2 1 [Sphingomonas bacterium]|nr:cph2 1 [Sphingomonas bacterium]
MRPTTWSSPRCFFATGFIALFLRRGSQLWTEIDQRRFAESSASAAARPDYLTGIPNRLACAEHLPTITTAASPAAVLLIDLNGFNTADDQFGHAAGDAVLQEFAPRLARAEEGSAFLGRLGVDELRFLLGGKVGPRDIRSIADELEGKIVAPIATPAGRFAYVRPSGTPPRTRRRE